MPSQPNIVFIHAESMDGRKMGCMGHPAMQNATPNMDRLASDGVLFTNAYTNCPVCNPSPGEHVEWKISQLLRLLE